MHSIAVNCRPVLVQTTGRASNDSSELFLKKAMDLARAPFSGLFMKAFMMYMIGSSINIFTIFAVSTALTQPIKAIADTATGSLSVHAAPLFGFAPLLLAVLSRLQCLKA